VTGVRAEPAPTVGLARARRIAALVALGLIAASCGGTSHSPAAASGDGLVPVGAGLRGLAGLRATAYTHGVPSVAALALDPQGRIWAATADYTDKGNDGVFVAARPGARAVKVVAGLHTPLGLLWYHEALYVASAGRVEAFSDFDGSTFATRRTILTFPAGTGQNNGIVLAPDGRMRMGISAPCDHCTPASTWAASVVSFLPDGSDLRVDASGIRAPIGLAYYPGTSDLFVTMNQRDDLGARTPGDWLAVVRRGQAWGFPSCYGQGGAACTDAPHPTAVLEKHAAVSGLAIVTGRLGRTAGSSALVAEWAKGKVQRVALHRTGSAYKGSVAPFLTGMKRPVPVLLGSSGTLFVGDWATGTVYSISAR
jgi:glucose/arabinose dehydrogenase